MREITIEIDNQIRRAAPEFKVIVMQAAITNRPTTDAVKNELRKAAENIKQRYAIAEINKRPGIYGTRQAYKACGKDPNRYRPSQEQLCRRIVSGKELYFVSNAVDVFNAVSIMSGYSIGAFDADKIVGDKLTLGIGRAGEPYCGIGRGELNIEGMPVYRDEAGGVGTPTSDNERTKLADETTSLLVCVNIYNEEMPADEVIELSRSLLEKHCAAIGFTATIVE
ncbi:MAG: phenylalanine--tRNA ligase beta subunit-related protein [Muribaculum sp.]|nr:phenylalanine--tRNA ligase beta subunit-related protein [Muribaculaceae bacterium]MCM1081162.1 phenylalanine--tRNA ligase beta subunit-related protein [Muribaculum sp.]